MKDASYTIRAELGNIDNPFSTTGIAGNATATDSAQTRSLPAVVSSTVTPPITTLSDSNGLDNGAKIGLGIGMGMGVPVVVIIFAFVIARRTPRKKTDRVDELQGAEKFEVHEEDAKIFEVGYNVSKTELPGAMGPELEGENGAELAGEWGHEMAGDLGRHTYGNEPRHELEAPQGISELPLGVTR